MPNPFAGQSLRGQALDLRDTVSLQWEIDLRPQQRLTLVRAAGLNDPIARRRWSELSAHERDALLVAAKPVLELAETLSSDLSG